MNTEKYKDEKIEITQFVSPQHLNHMGNMHGGEIFKLMDSTAGLAFTRCAKGNAVTAAADDIQFIKPIPCGTIIKCTAQVVEVRKTSIKTYAEVFVQDIVTAESYKAAMGTFIGVAIDEEGKPRIVEQ